jgi:hypothetical protein
LLVIGSVPLMKHLHHIGTRYLESLLPMLAQGRARECLERAIPACRARHNRGLCGKQP